MKPIRLFAIALFTIATVLAYCTWSDYIARRGPGAAVEGFEEKPLLSDAEIARLSRANEPVPSDAEAVAAHQTLLRYIRNDYEKGRYFVYDLGQRFFGPAAQVRDDLDVRTLLDNYSSPLQRV
jgi:hypothetical protein